MAAWERNDVLPGEVSQLYVWTEGSRREEDTGFSSQETCAGIRLDHSISNGRQLRSEC